ncbi:MAG: flagellar biosynthetic protein FliQ [Pararhodobacter sp.]|nr:flagellar biosynthetic protein FliQ [Pararhodobacter sp.]
MRDVAFFDILRQALWVSVAMSAPVLTAALVSGLAVGLLQALTSVQEMTLTFVPKVLAILIAFWVSMSFMTGLLVAFFQGQVLPLITGT